MGRGLVIALRTRSLYPVLRQQADTRATRSTAGVDVVVATPSVRHVRRPAAVGSPSLVGPDEERSRGKSARRRWEWCGTGRIAGQLPRCRVKKREQGRLNGRGAPTARAESVRQKRWKRPIAGRGNFRGVIPNYPECCF